jgi:hypothetical protein
MDAQWWVSINGDQKGPLSTPVLREWLAEGRIPPTSLVRCGDGPWVMARKVKPVRTDWHSVFGGLAVAAGLLLAVEVFWLGMGDRAAGGWGLGLLAVYVAMFLRVFGLRFLFGKG